MNVTEPQSPDWDNSKENFQPLRRGRAASALKDSTEHPRQAALDEEKRYGRARIAKTT